MRAIRSRMMLKSMGYESSLFNAIAGVMVGYLANLAIPRLGEFARSGVVSKYDKISYEKVFGTIILERIMDVICLLTMIALGFILRFDALWTYISSHLNISTNTVIAFTIILTILTVSGYLIIKKITITDRERLPPFLGKLQSMIGGFMEGLGSIRKLDNLPLFIFYSIGIWFFYYAMHYLAFFAYEPTSHLNAVDGLLVFDFGSLGVVFPSPGGMGSYHAMIVEALKILSVDPVSGFSFAMITFFTLTIFCNIIFGISFLLLLPIINYRKT